MTEGFLNSLLDKEWPGNIRELNNYIERQFVLSDETILDNPDNTVSGSNTGGNISVKGLPSMHEAKLELESIFDCKGHGRSRLHA